MTAMGKKPSEYLPGFPAVRGILFLAGLVWPAIVIWFYIRNHPLIFPPFTLIPSPFTRLLDILPGFLAVLLTFTGGFGWLSLAGCSPTMKTLLGSLPAGIAAISFTGTVLGTTVGFGLPTRLLMTATIVFPSLVWWFGFPFSRVRSELAGIATSSAGGSGLAIILVVGSLAMVATVAPAISYDDQVYHLTIPEQYLSLGRIQPLPELSPSNRPQNLHIFYTFVRFFGPEQSVRFASGIFGLLTAALLLLYLGYRINPFAGMLAGLVWVTQPEMFWLAQTAYVDLPLVFLTVSGFFFIAERHLHTASPHPPLLAGKENRDWLTFGILSGLIAGAKTSGLIFAAFLLVMYGTINRREAAKDKNGHSQTRDFLLTFGTAALLGSFWYFRNWILIGNPVYPHLGNLFPSKAAINSADAAFRAVFNSTMPFVCDQDDFLDRFGMGSSFQSLFMLPWNVTINCHVHDTEAALTFFDGEIGFLPLAFLPHLLWDAIRRKNSGLRWAVGLSAIFFFQWGAGSHQIRFLMPTLATAAIALGLWSANSKVWRIPVLIAILFAVLSAGSFAAQRLGRIAEFMNGQLDSEEQIVQALPFYQSFKFMNGDPRVRGRILPLFEERVFYLEKPFLWMELIPYPFLSALIVAKNPAKVSEYLRSLNIDTIYIPQKIRLELPAFLGTPGFKENARRFFNEETVQIYEDSFAEVHLLKERKPGH